MPLFLDEIIETKFLTDFYVAVCSNSETIKIFDTRTNTCEIVKGHTDIVVSLDIFQVDNIHYIVSGAKDNEIRMWTWAEGCRTTCIGVYKGHVESVTSVCFAPKKGQFFVSAGQDNSIKVWDFDASIPEDNALKVVNSAKMTILAHQKYVNVIRVSPNDKMIASASQDKSIKVWNPANLSLLLTLTGHKRGVWDVAFSPADKVLVSGSGDSMIKTWNLTTGDCLATLQGHSDQLVRVQWLN